MNHARLVLLLGDQLSENYPALADAEPARDVILMAEVAEEAGYVRHNRHKVALVFSAMRYFRDRLRGLGHTVHYLEYSQGMATLEDAVRGELKSAQFDAVHVCEPGEYRLREVMRGWSSRLGVPVRICPDTRFLASQPDFDKWADAQKQLRMESFYRRMRLRYGLLLDSDRKPSGGKWNYDSSNRRGWRNLEAVPARPQIAQDALTKSVIEEVQSGFPENPGDLSRFNYAVTAAQAQAQLDWVCENALGRFGTYQDGLAEESPWLFHSLVSMYLNIGLLEPLAVCRQVERAWREDKCDLAAAEGFIRQVLGWREYVRGIYWRFMPDYKDLNHFEATTPLPGWFWTGETDMRCLSRALKQSLDLGYGHHIQRLMVIGNFALLASLDVQAVCAWYLAVYVDAYEWVELPNTLGMALYADGGLMASKPYAASGRYIQRQGNHCAGCRYDPKQTTGEVACPYNAMYWRFIDRNRQTLAGNGRMGVILGSWAKRDAAEKKAIVAWADRSLEQILEIES